MKKKPSQPAKTPTQIQELLFNAPESITDAQLLVLVLGMGTTRHGKGRVKKIWTVFALASDLLAEAGGRLEHLVATARRADFDRGHFGLGKILGSRLIVAMELAHRWRKGFKRRGNPGVRLNGDFDLLQEVLERKEDLTEGELVVALLSEFPSEQKEAASHLASYPSPEHFVRSMTPRAYLDSDGWRLRLLVREEAVYRLLAACELACRHRARAGFERPTLKKGAFGVSSSYLLKLVDPESPIDRPRRQGLLAKVRQNPRMAANFAKLDRLASDALTDDYEQAIKLHLMFEALCENREWTQPAEVLGEPVAYRALLSIAEAGIERAPRRPDRILRVKDLLTAAELDATRESRTAFVAALVKLGVSEAGLEKVFEEARRGYSRSVGP